MLNNNGRLVPASWRRRFVTCAAVVTLLTMAGIAVLVSLNRVEPPTLVSLGHDETSLAPTFEIPESPPAYVARLLASLPVAAQNSTLPFWPVPHRDHPFIQSSRTLRWRFESFTNVFQVVNVTNSVYLPWFASPSVARLKGKLFVAYDVYLGGHHSASIIVSRSDDNGETWTQVAHFDDKGGWGTLFVSEDEELYLAYTRLQKTFEIRRARNDEGTSWTKSSILFGPTSVHSHNGAVTVIGDSVYIAIKQDRSGPTLFARAPNRGNLLHPEMWTFGAPNADPVQQALGLLKTGISMPQVVNYALSYFTYTGQTAMRELFGMESRQTEEPVVYRTSDPNKFRIMLRVTNNVMCGMAAILNVDLTDKEAAPVVSFDRYTEVPGLGASHPFVFYDEKSGFYFMLSQYQRDTFRNITGTSLWHHDWCACSDDRSAIGLFFSRNGITNWLLSAFVGFSLDWSHHFTYPQCIVEKDDLLCVMRSHVLTNLSETNMNSGVMHDCWQHQCKRPPITASNHNSNAITMHRIPNFRRLADDLLFAYETYG